MAIQWNQVQGVQPPSVIAQLPMVQPQNTADQFAGGLMQGIAQANQAKLQQVQMAAAQQQMNQSKALFPGQQQIQQQTIKSNDITNQSAQIDLTNKQQAQAYVTSLRNAAKNGEQAYINAMSPTDRIAYMQSKATLMSSYATANMNNARANKDNADAGKSIADTTGIQLTNADKIASNVAQVNNAAMSGQTPEQKEAIYQQGKQYLPKDVQQKMSPNFDQNTAVASLVIYKQKMADAVQQKVNENPTEDMKNTQTIGDLTQKAKDSGLSVGEQTQLDGMKALQNVKANKLVNAPEVQKVTDYITTLKQDVAAAPAGSPAQKAAQAKLDFAVSQAKQNTSFWSQIKSSVADSIGGAAGSAVKAMVPKRSAPTFQKGVVHQDANGNKATYVGGDPKDPKSWETVK